MSSPNPSQPATAVLIPGTGSDDTFLRSAFSGATETAGIRLVAVPPEPGPRLHARYRAALDEAAASGPVLAGGVSLGAHIAAEWAAAHPDRCAGLIAVMPGWIGAPDGAAAARSALASAELVDDLGTAAALDRATDGTPPWLAGQLRRAWPRYGDELADSLRRAAALAAPDRARLAGVRAPAVVVGCLDDPVHPFAVAEQWAAALPAAVLRTVTLGALDTGLGVLGDAAFACSDGVASIGPAGGAVQDDSAAARNPPSPTSVSPESHR